METVRSLLPVPWGERWVGGAKVADPAESLKIVLEKARYLIEVSRTGGGQFSARAELGRNGAALGAIAIIDHTSTIAGPRLAAEVGLGRVRPYGAVKGRPDGPLTPPRSREGFTLPTQAWEAIAPAIIECLRDWTADRIESRWKIKDLFRKRQLVLRFNGNGVVEPAKPQGAQGDEREAAMAAVPWRGVRVSVHTADAALVDLFHSFELTLNSELERRLFAFASVLWRLLKVHHRELRETAPPELRVFLSRPGQEYFFRPHLMFELFQVRTRTPRYEWLERTRHRRRRNKSGDWSTTKSRCRKRKRRRGDIPMLEYPAWVLKLFAAAGCIRLEEALRLEQLLQAHRWHRNPFAPYAGCDFGVYAQDIEVRSAAGPRGPRLERNSAPRRRRWHPPAYLVFDVRIAPHRHERVVSGRRAEQELFADLDAIIQGG